MTHPTTKLNNPYYFFSDAHTENESEYSIVYNISDKQDAENNGKHLVTYQTEERTINYGQTYVDKNGNLVNVIEGGTYGESTGELDYEKCAKTFPYIKINYRDNYPYECITITGSDDRYIRDSVKDWSIAAVTEQEEEYKIGNYFAWTFEGRTIYTFTGLKPYQSPQIGDWVYEKDGMEITSLLEKVTSYNSDHSNEEIKSQYLWLDYLIDVYDTYENGVFKIDSIRSAEGYVAYYKDMLIKEIGSLLIKDSIGEAKRKYPDYLFAKEYDEIRLEDGQKVCFLSVEQSGETDIHVANEDILDGYYIWCNDKTIKYANSLLNINNKALLEEDYINQDTVEDVPAS